MFIFSERSLEQHEQEIRKPLEDKIKELIKSKNEQENILLDKIIKLQKQLKQERRKVIAELEEWAKQHEVNVGIDILDYEDLRQKLNEMKGEVQE